MRIPLSSALPDDLVSVPVDGVFTIEFRVSADRGGSVVQGGTRYLVAHATAPDLAAVRSLTDEVDLLQRVAAEPGARDDREPVRHPHGWAITHPDGREMHYFEDTRSVCGQVAGYAGLCYPHFDQAYFPWRMKMCPLCVAEREG